MKAVGVVIPTVGAPTFLDCVASLPAGVRLYVRDNRKDNWGVAKSWNWGIEAALKDRCSYVLVINDDIVIENAAMFCDNLIAALDAPDVILATGQDVRLEAPAWDTPNFSAFMVTRATIKAVGLFDTQFWPAYFEDNDYHERIKKAGLRTLSPLGAYFTHYASASIKHLPEIRALNAAHFMQNRERFYRKWGWRPGVQ